MEAMLGICLYSYPISTSKNALFFLLLFMSPLQQNWRKGQNRFCLAAREVGGKERRQGGEMAQTMYAHINT
jgi:hypothetical protein